MGGTWNFDDLFGLGRRAPDRPAVIFLRERETEILRAGDLDRLPARLAAALAAGGVATGDPVALIGPNGTDWIVCWLALARLGAVVVGLDDLYSPEEAAAAIADAGCRTVIAGRAHVEALRAASLPGAIAMIALDGGAAPDGVRHWRELLGGDEAAPAKRAPQDPAVMLYTSGTTGRPKSFTLSRANIAANVGAVLAERILRPGDKVLLPLPLHHAYPLIVGLLTPLAAGAAVVLPKAAAGPDILRALTETRATVMVGVPRLYAALADGLESRVRDGGRFALLVFRALLALARGLRHGLGINAGRVLFAPLHRRLGGALRIMVSGGARVEPETAERLDALGFEVLSGYGLAETASLFTGNRPGRKRAGSEGLPLAGGRVRIARPDEDGNGEIQLKGPSVFAGYRNAPEDNAAAFTADGWFRTGDLGRLDADGYLYVTGRATERLVLGGGKKVFPEELEKRLGADPAIAEIAVLERDGKLVALVRPDLAQLRAEAKTRPRDAVRIALEQAMAGLPSHQRLAGFELARDPLPRTRLGKYRRFRLPELYARAREGAARTAAPAPMSAADRELIADALGAKVWDLLEARYGARGLAMDASPELDLGIDSLEWMTLTLELESRLGLRIDAATAAGVTTMRDLVRAAKGAAGAPPPATAGIDLDDPAWIAPRGPLVHALGLVLDAANRALARIFFRLGVDTGPPLIEPGRPFVIVANHASDLDGAFLSAALPGHLARRLWWAGEVTRLFAGAFARGFCRVAQIFPIDERRPQAAIDLASRVLGRGDGLAWFPESWRTPTGELQRFLPGIGAILLKADAIAVPAAILGSFEVLPRGARRPRPARVRVRFGAAVSHAELVAEGSGANDAERIADALERRVARLIGEMRA